VEGWQQSLTGWLVLQGQVSCQTQLYLQAASKRFFIQYSASITFKIIDILQHASGCELGYALILCRNLIWRWVADVGFYET
jgi:hypothetical protein